jgi:cytochrome c-type protein NapB
MRIRALPSPWLLVALVPLLLLGGGSIDETPESKDGMDVYFRSTDLLALSEQGLPEYPDTPAGEAGSLGRDFPDAPPQIPHTTEDMYPITLDDNECLECHLPENASKGDVPVPESHFKAPVMGKGGPDDAMVWVVKDYQKSDELVGARYNCSMCHTPQAGNVDTPSSTFLSMQKSKDGKKQEKAKDEKKKRKFWPWS